MPHYTYLIIGGGLAADAAVRGIRQVDPTGAIGLISAEPDPPYDRPPLSKGLWKGEPLDGIWRGTASQGVALHLARTAQSLDPGNKQVTDDQGTVYTYNRLLLATWKEPYREGVVYYLREDRVRGVLLWNVWGQVEAARRLIAAPGPVRPADLRGRLPRAE